MKNEETILTKNLISCVGDLQSFAWFISNHNEPYFLTPITLETSSHFTVLATRLWNLELKR